MRQIGTLPKSADTRAFGDHLLTLGVTSRAVESPDGWAIWVHDENKLDLARVELGGFLNNPDDPRFHTAAEAAAALRREQERLDREYRKNVRSLSGTWDRINVRRRPLTVFLVAVCVAVFLAEQVSPAAQLWLLDTLRFFPISAMRPPMSMRHGLDAIHGGQLWRLITPIFLHGNIIHLAFNVWATVIEGTLIETRRSTRTMLALVLLSAVASNVGQYVYVLNFYPNLVPWVGISGVGYAMFGYLWMKGLYEPEQGMILHPSSVRIMLGWLLLGFTGLFPMANGAHVVGLIVGVLFGLARF